MKKVSGHTFSTTPCHLRWNLVLNEQLYIYLYVYICIWGCPVNCADWCKSSKTILATLYIRTWLNFSQGSCLAFQLAGAAVCLSAQICSKSHFSSK